jgi:threonine synthase
MRYICTRGHENGLKSAAVIKKGLADNGGLFVPGFVPKIKTNELESFINMTYAGRAFCVLKKFLTDFSDKEIKSCIGNAYNQDNFDHQDIAPLHKLNEHVYILELWHGPTSAFKDMALQIMPYFMKESIKKSGDKEKTLILVATSGDTGKAALEGFKDIEGIEIVVFYPEQGVSEVQKMQMVTQEGENVNVFAVDGNFDDAQNGVKEIFTGKEVNDLLLDKGYKFSSANSINWGRLLPQIVYYISSYADLLKKDEIKINEKINIVVPTGNFGNILAAYYAKHMGLPVNKLICASNINNILTDFLNKGTYNTNREFIKTMSPSMDILISSNLERLLFEITGHDHKLINELMSSLKENGEYTITEDLRKTLSEEFWGGYCNEQETLDIIKNIYDEYGYVMDTHTAVGVDVYDKYIISTHDLTKTVIASTASPFKFNTSVMKALSEDGEIHKESEFELIKRLSEMTGLSIPEGLKDLSGKAIRFKTACKKEEMKEIVLSLF